MQIEMSVLDDLRDRIEEVIDEVETDKLILKHDIIFRDIPYEFQKFGCLYHDGYHYKLRFNYRSHRNELIIHAGSEFDGASGSINTDTNTMAALPHDCFCESANAMLILGGEYAKKAKAIRKEADYLFYCMLRANECNWFRARYHYAAVAGYRRFLWD